ncbi:site-2 protease family protein [Magnetovibrio sp. PR-2]|uniref:site-2 protease family protein n=1 Tax=Magnetovibrio sp. PR-2 TaxID=3120356 RepID=UPI002FCE5358
MMDFDFYQFLVVASVWVIPVLLAVTLHEAAHGWVASKLGDDTALRMGRVTFNPFKHIDLFGTILMPAGLLLVSGGQFMFGFAKPVPVNFYNLRSPRRDMVLVAAAGPGANLLIATVSALLLHVVAYIPETMTLWTAENLINLIKINVILAVFNLLPLPPLDGGRIAVGVLPQPFAGQLARLERAGFGILIFLLFILPWIGGKIGADLDFLSTVILVPSQWVMEAIVTITGIN